MDGFTFFWKSQLNIDEAWLGLQCSVAVLRNQIDKVEWFKALEEKDSKRVKNVKTNFWKKFG